MKEVKRVAKFGETVKMLTDYYVFHKGQELKCIEECNDNVNLFTDGINNYYLSKERYVILEKEEEKEMKFIDKYDQEHEGRNESSYRIGCPYDYGYEDYEDSSKFCTGHSCKECWNREIPEKTEKPKEDKELTTSPWEPAPKCGMLEADQSKEMVNHPSHYNQGKREVIEEMRILFGDEAVESFCRLNAYKYLRRAEFKGNKKEDLDKAEWYMDYLEMMRGEE